MVKYFVYYLGLDLVQYLEVDEKYISQLHLELNFRSYPNTILDNSLAKILGTEKGKKLESLLGFELGNKLGSIF